MNPLLLIFYFVIGAAIGSFINVLSLRYDPERKIFRRGVIGGRSHCPHCKKTLRWFELIPLASFALQLGRCRTCRGRLSLQYPIVELLAGIAAAAVPYFLYRHYGVAFAAAQGEPIWWYYALSAIWTLAAFTFIFLSAVDFRLTIIPDQSNMLIILLGVAAILIAERFTEFSDLKGSFLGHYAALFGFRRNIWTNHLFAALVGLLFFAAVVAVTRGRGMGLGDVKLAGVSGLLLGWPDIGLATMIAFVLGAAVGLVLILLGRKKFKQGIPFGPYIAIGVFLTVFFGRAIMAGYFELFPV